MLFAEVRDADGARSAVGEEGLGGLVGGDRVLEVCRHRLVQQVQVDVVETEPPQAGLEADLCRVVAVVADPQLGRDVGTGLAVRGEQARSAGGEVDAWLRRTRLSRANDAPRSF